MHPGLSIPSAAERLFSPIHEREYIVRVSHGYVFNFWNRGPYIKFVPVYTERILKERGYGNQCPESDIPDSGFEVD